MASEEKSAQGSSGQNTPISETGEHPQGSGDMGNGEGVGSSASAPEDDGLSSFEDLGERQSPEGGSEVEGSIIDAVAEQAGTEGEGGVEDVVDVQAEPEVLEPDESVELLPSAAELAEARDQVERYRDQALRAQAELENVRKRTARDVENAHKYALEGFVKSILPVRDSLELGLAAAQKQKNVSEKVSDESSGGSNPAQGSMQGDMDAGSVSSSESESGLGSKVEGGGEGEVSSEQPSSVDTGSSEPQSADSAAGDPAGDSGIDKIVEGMTLTLEMLDGVMGKHGIETIDPMGESFNPELHQAISEMPGEGVASKTVIDVIQKGCLLNGRVIRAAMVVIAK